MLTDDFFADPDQWFFGKGLGKTAIAISPREIIILDLGTSDFLKNAARLHDPNREFRDALKPCFPEVHFPVDEEWCVSVITSSIPGGWERVPAGKVIAYRPMVGGRYKTYEAGSQVSFLRRQHGVILSEGESVTRRYLIGGGSRDDRVTDCREIITNIGGKAVMREEKF